LEKKRIHPTEIAFTVTEMLEEHFPEIVDSGFTANMEETLDEVAEGNTDWQTILKAFYTPFLQKIEEGKKNIKSLKIAIPTGEDCPKCGSELLLRKGRYGEFIACSNFPKCKYTKNTDGTEVEGPEETDEKCEKCGSMMVIKNSKRGKFLACSAYPKCKNAKAVKAEVEGLNLIACNGTATKEQLTYLKEHGIDSYNHNLETSERYYAEICQTHTWSERYKTCENVRSVGLALCSGGIFGMGETEKDREELLKAIASLSPESTPLNFYHPNPALLQRSARYLYRYSVQYLHDNVQIVYRIYSLPGKFQREYC